MAIAAYRDTSPAPRYSGVADGIPEPRATVTEPPRLAERVIEGEVIGQIRQRGILTTRDFLQMRGLAMSHASVSPEQSRARTRLRADPGKGNASAGMLDIYV